MPELPEVEVIVKHLRPQITGRKITGIQTDWPKYFGLQTSTARFAGCAVGKKITAVGRRGKYILIHLTEDYLLLIHQKLSGRLLVGNWARQSKGQVEGAVHSRWRPVPAPGSTAIPQGRFIHLIFDLDDGRQLGLSDLRKFAKVRCGREADILSLPEIAKLGPEPLDRHFTFSRFKLLFAGRKGGIKQMLMNPKFIAGIGNIYSDEILYAAGIHPLSQLSHLREPQLKILYASIKNVLGKAIRMGGTGVDRTRAPKAAASGYDMVRMVYQRESCPRGHEIRRIKIGGRSAHFCPSEQKLL